LYIPQESPDDGLSGPKQVAGGIMKIFVTVTPPFLSDFFATAIFCGRAECMLKNISCNCTGKGSLQYLHMLSNIQLKKCESVKGCQQVMANVHKHIQYLKMNM
jgi:hypothetical protein